MLYLVHVESILRVERVGKIVILNNAFSVANRR